MTEKVSDLDKFLRNNYLTKSIHIMNIDKLKGEIEKLKKQIESNKENSEKIAKNLKDLKVSLIGNSKVK